MKVGLCTGWAAEKDGISDYSYHLSAGLRGEGLDVVVVPLRNYQRGFSFYRRAARLANQTDIAHVQFNYLYFNSEIPLRNKFLFFSSRVRVPLVITAHEVRIGFSPELTGFSSVWKEKVFKASLRLWNNASVRMHREIYERSDRIIVHNPVHAVRITDLLPDSGKVVVLPHGIPEISDALLHVPADEAKKQLGLAHKRVVTVFGFIDRRKDYLQIIRVLRECPADVALVIAGGLRNEERINVSYYEQIVSAIGRCGLGERVKITGYLSADAIPQVMAATDVCLAPYYSEAASGALSLCLAFHKPVIAADTEVMCQVSGPAGCLELYDGDDEAGLREKLLRLLADEGMRASLGEKAAEYARANSYARIAGRTKRIYEECLGIDH